MKKTNKRILQVIVLMAFVVIFTGCSSEPIVVGETAPQGLFDLLVVYPISWLIDTIFHYTGNGGVAIMLTTILISLIVSPLEIKSQVETRKQQEIQPLIEELGKKYPDNKTDKVQQQKYAVEQQRIYNENGMKLTGMCLPMLLLLFIQSPILMGMFGAVRRLTLLNQSTFSLFGMSYSYGLPDPGLPVPLIGHQLKLFIILAIISIFISTFFTQPKGKRNPKTNKLAMQAYLMNFMFVFILWNQPIALAIYWIVSNLTRTVLRLTIVNKIVDKQHEEFKKLNREKKAKKYK